MPAPKSNVRTAAIVGVAAIAAAMTTAAVVVLRRRRRASSSPVVDSPLTPLQSSPAASPNAHEPRAPASPPSSAFVIKSTQQHSDQIAPTKANAAESNAAPSNGSPSQNDDDGSMLRGASRSFADDTFTRGTMPSSAAAAGAPTSSEPTRLVLVITAPQHQRAGPTASDAKSKLRSLARTAAAFEASEVVFAGLNAAMQSELRVPRSTSCRFTFTPEVASVAARLRQQAAPASPIDALMETAPLERSSFAPPSPSSQRVAVVGLDIMPGAISVDSPAFAEKLQASQVVCLVAGSDSSGLSEAAKATCDWFCYVPQLRAAATLSSHTNVAIALHRVASAAGVRSGGGGGVGGFQGGGRSLSDGGTGTIISEDASLAACDDEQEVLQTMGGTDFGGALMHSDSDLSESQNPSGVEVGGGSGRRRWSPAAPPPAAWSAMQSPVKNGAIGADDGDDDLTVASPNAKNPATDYDAFPRPLHGTDSMVSVKGGSFSVPPQQRSAFSRSVTSRASLPSPAAAAASQTRGKAFTFSRHSDEAALRAALSPDLAANLALPAGAGVETPVDGSSSPVAARRPAGPAPQPAATRSTRIHHHHHTGSSRRWTPRGFEEDF